MMQQPISTNTHLTVFYDGACPLCSREIAFYRRRRGAATVAWIDIAQTGAGEVIPGLSRDQALARFHVVETNGKLLSGGAAFSRLWQEFPVFRPLGLLLQVWPFSSIAEYGYLLFLKFRPGLQSMFLDRSRGGAGK